MICPACSEEMEPIGTDIAPPLAMCPECERSLVLTDGAPRLAQAADVKRITDDQLAALRKLRPDTLAARRAYYATHH